MYQCIAGALTLHYDPAKGEAAYQPVDYSTTRKIEMYIEQQEGWPGIVSARIAAVACTGTAFWDAGVHSFQGIKNMGQGELSKGAFHVARAIRFTILAPFALVGLLVPGAVKVIDSALGATSIQGNYQVKGAVAKGTLIGKRMYTGVKRAGKRLGNQVVCVAKTHPKITKTICALGAVSAGVAGVFACAPEITVIDGPSDLETIIVGISVVSILGASLRVFIFGGFFYISGKIINKKMMNRIRYVRALSKPGYAIAFTWDIARVSVLDKGRIATFLQEQSP